MNESSSDKTPSACTAMQQQLEVLKWCANARKVIANLPKGKCREDLERSVQIAVGDAVDLIGMRLQVYPSYVRTWVGKQIDDTDREIREIILSARRTDGLSAAVSVKIQQLKERLAAGTDVPVTIQPPPLR